MYLLSAELFTWAFDVKCKSKIVHKKYPITILTNIDLWRPQHCLNGMVVAYQSVVGMVVHMENPTSSIGSGDFLYWGTVHTLKPPNPNKTKEKHCSKWSGIILTGWAPKCLHTHVIAYVFLAGWSTILCLIVCLVVLVKWRSAFHANRLVVVWNIAKIAILLPQ